MSFSFKKSNPMSVEEENFWPSFADIMMLIVMIFLMVMVVLVIKNWDLVTKLKSSIEAKQQITATATMMSQENSTLKNRLDESLAEIAKLRMMALNIGEELETTRISLENSEALANDLKQQIIILGEEKQVLELEASKAALKFDEVSAQLENKNQIIIALEKDASRAKEDFSALKYKYDKLVRPARSPKGKTVVEVSLLKNGGKQILSIRLPGKESQVVSQNKMHQILADYKKKEGDKLYLKIIFPQESQISHQDAWSFTSSLLNKYDYYYQENR